MLYKLNLHNAEQLKLDMKDLCPYLSDHWYSYNKAKNVAAVSIGLNLSFLLDCKSYIGHSGSREQFSFP